MLAWTVDKRFALAVFVLSLAGCAKEPEQVLIGKWAGDTSAVGMAIKAAKLKADNPDASGQTAMDAARALSSVALVISKDKSCQLYMGGNTFKGTWTFDKADNLALLELTSVELGPHVAAAANQEPFKPQNWFCELDPGEEKVTLCLGDRETWKLMKEIRKKQALPGLMVLRKK